MQDISLVPAVQAQEPWFLPNQYQQSMEISPYHSRKRKDVQIAQERERLEI